MPRLTFFLDSGLDPAAYAERWERGLAPDRHPYGTENVPEGWGFDFAMAPVPARLRRVAGFARRVLGFDLVRAMVNASTLRSAEAVYCHTEVEYLAVAAVLLGRRRPLVVGQTIWIFHAFDGLHPLKRLVYRRLLSRVDLLVSNSTANHRLGERLAPRASRRYIPFGISRMFATVRQDPSRPDVLGVGNDMARDWPLFASALAAVPEAEIRVASKAPVLVDGRSVSEPTKDVHELLDLYGTSRLVVVAVRENAHASGITTLLEAVAAGTPAIATRAGGLDDYFSDDEVRFVAPGDERELTEAVTELLADEGARRARAAAAKARQDEAGYWNDIYWQRVVAAVSDLPARR